MAISVVGWQTVYCPSCRVVLGEWMEGSFRSNHKGKNVEFSGIGRVRVQCPGTLCRHAVWDIDLDYMAITMVKPVLSRWSH